MYGMNTEPDESEIQQLLLPAVGVINLDTMPCVSLTASACKFGWLRLKSFGIRHRRYCLVWRHPDSVDGIYSILYYASPDGEQSGRNR
jgi:hypothetical protein